jgi:hypothetical protein
LPKNKPWDAAITWPKYRDVSLEFRPQTDTGLQPSIIKQQRRACDMVRAGDTLVLVHGQQHAG